MTVKELYNYCEEQIKNGNGDRDVILCVNGDEFKPLDGGFSSPVYNDSAIYDALEDLGLEEDDAIILN